MKEVLIVLIFFIFSSCSNNSKIEKVEFIISPSFSHPTEYTIDTKRKTLKIYSFQDHYYINEPIDSVSYKSIRKDTLIEYFNQTYNLKEKDLKAFIKKTNQLDSTYQNIEHILDGVGYRIQKITSNKDTISVTSNITERKDKTKLEYELLDAFFTLAENNIDDFKGNSILEGTQFYLSYKNKVKKLKYKIEQTSENPIEFKLWGNLNGCKAQNQELLTFLKNLPNEKPVIFDLRKGDFSDCIYKTLIPELKSKVFYYYGNEKIKYFEYQIERIKNEIEKGDDSLPKNEKLIDSLLNEQSNKVILKELVLTKDSLNSVNLYLNKNQIIKTIANNQYKQ